MIKQVDRALLMSDSAPLAIGFFIGTDCVDCNFSAVEMFGYDSKDEYVNSFYHTLPTFQPTGRSSKKFFYELISKALEDGNAKSEILCRSAEGALIPMEVTLVRTIQGNETFVLCYFANLTGIQIAMKEAANTAEMTQMYLSASPLAMELFDGYYRILDCNQQALDLLGYTEKGEYYKRNTYLAPDYLYHDIYTRVLDRQYFQQAMENGFVRYEWVFQKENGEKLPCEITRVRIIRPDGKFVVSYIHDLSTIRAMAEELKKAEAVERENRAKSQFLAQMSHVLRTPMNAISGLTDIQLQKNNTMDAEETLVQIQRFTKIQLGIISDILDLANVDAGKLELAIKQIDVPSLIVDIVQINLMGMDNENITFSLIVDENLPFVMLGDELRVKQIVSHLVRNAFKFTERGTVTLHFHCEPLDADNITFVITVTDTGQGMSQEQITNLLGENARYNEHGKIQGTGAGLGLLITQRLIQLMEGTVEISSEISKGSTFIVKINLQSFCNATLGAETVEKLQTMGKERYDFKRKITIDYEPMPYGKVLIVDDVESNLFVAKGLMEPYGLQIETVTGGIEAVEKIKSGEEYDIIFMDHMMPDMDGVEATKAIIGLEYMRPVVALTANALLGQASLFKENGFAGFISKPIDTKHLHEYLMRYIRDKYPEDIREKARTEMPTRIAPKQSVSEELSKHFIRDAKNAAKVLEQLITLLEFSGDDFNKYTIFTHGMKSALANVGISDLSKVAESLEAAGREKNTSKISADTPNFISDLKEVITAFEEKISAASALDIDVEDDLVLLNKQLTALIEACDIFHKPSAKKAMTTLKEGQCSKKTLALIDEINALLLHGEFEEAAELAQNHMNT
ncbi:MAG: ATP-binding protein [Defluviitaleaceae bacterium]|nr:ATP-binding protein [Defluviitaleaceae bacterium]